MTKRSFVRLLVIISIALAATLTPSHALAQTKTSTQTESFVKGELPPPASVPTSVPTLAPAPDARERVALKIDEFGPAGGCDHSARLDNFAIELQNRADATAYVIAYGPAGEANGAAEWRLELTRSYLVETRGITPERIQTLYGGPYRGKDETFVEFWLVPFGAEPPTPAKYENDAASFHGKFADYQSWDGIDLGEELGPTTGDTTLAGFAEVLKLQPKTVAYVAAYNGKDDAPGAWRRAALREAESIENEYSVESSRVKVIFAGYSEVTRIQLWVVDADAPPPVKERKRERRPKESVRIGTFDEYILRYEEHARFVFKGFADVLKADEQLTACIIIHAAQAKPEDADPSYPVDPNEPPKVDLVQLAQNWKERLKKEYGIGEHRLVILVGPPAEEWAPGELQTWVVPPGATLPDPSATDAIDADEQAEESSTRSL